jgi:hypothetical protein
LELLLQVVLVPVLAAGEVSGVLDAAFMKKVKRIWIQSKTILIQRLQWLEER